MSEFYTEMQDIAKELLGEFQQGSVLLVREAKSSPPARPHDVTVGVPETWSLLAAVRTVTRDMIDGHRVLGGEDMVVFAVPDTVPTLGDLIRIDGRERKILSLKPIPGAGTVVAWKAVVGF